MRVRERLARACRAAREQAELSQMRIAVAAEVSDKAISRFERGETWPDRVEDVVDAYETECGLDPLTLWRRALEVDP